MESGQDSATSAQLPDSDASLEAPQGDHPLETAARRGIGPLSPLAEQVWHGNAMPCVSCGQLVLRDQRQCDNCGQDLSDEMIEKMRAHAGPWYVLEHLRPFPGVSLERVIRQIRRGVLTETSIVRGPATDFQWRFAVETAGLCRYFGRCWKCHAAVSPSDAYCPACLSFLSFDSPKPMRGAPLEGDAAGRSPDKSTGVPLRLRELSAAIDVSQLPQREESWDRPARVGRFKATWIAAIVLAAFLAALMWIVASRNANVPSKTVQESSRTADRTRLARPVVV